ncbi:MAG TPA: D-2-hydroxyacid dehydrogenase family protein [Xanthobacteraceae bacterium]|nr:D-2-hydroxyacid dehydrogenase family protein [Xanthobacteraceae bacterium]
MMAHRCVILDDYQNVALKLADWSRVSGELDIKVFNAPLGGPDSVIEALRDAEIVCLMRERTPLPRTAIEALPKLKLIVTTGMYNASVDLAAAMAQGIVICGTRGLGAPTADLAMGLILDLARNISFENARLKQGEPWQVTVGLELMGRTLGLLGLGKLGSRVAKLAQAFDMQVIAWSQNLTEERCRELGVGYAGKEELFTRSDFLSVHLVLSDRTRGLIGAADFARMKSSAYFINTSRGPIVDERALIDALEKKRIAGAAIDVYDVEPLPVDHALRRLPNALLTPHLGYVTEGNYRTFYGDTVDNIRAWLDGKPVRVVTANK